MFWSVSGSAPVAISGARNSASDWVCPLITAEPPVMPWLQLMLESAATGGWLITTESRVIAISRLGSPTGLQAAAPVSFSKAVLPLPEKVSWVSHWPVETPLVAVWICAWAPVMSVPPSATGPICSLVALAVGRCWPDSVAQSTVCWFGLSLASQVSGLPQSTLSKGACLYLGSLAGTSASTGRNWSCAVVPTARMTSSEFCTSGIATTMLPPSLVTSDSATPLEFTRLRMMSMVVSICCLVAPPPLGLCGLKATLCWLCLALLRARVRRRASEQRVTVQGNAKLAAEPFGGTAAHHHSVQEDLKILENVRDFRIDLQLERHRLLVGVDPDERVSCREVHSIVNVELDLGVLAYPGAVHVGLVGDDHRGGHRGDGVAQLLLVVADGADHQPDVLGRHAQLGQYRHGDQRRGLRVVVPADHVADVVQVPRDRGQLGQVTVTAEPVQDVEGDAANQVGVAEAVLRVAELGGELVGECQVCLHDLVPRHLVEEAQLARRVAAWFAAGRHGSSLSGSSGSSGFSSVGVTLPEMARRVSRASTPGESSTVTTSPSKRRIVPKKPAKVMISSPSSSEDCSCCCDRRRLRCGRTIKK